MFQPLQCLEIGAMTPTRYYFQVRAQCEPAISIKVRPMFASLTSVPHSILFQAKYVERQTLVLFVS